ncbi:MAG: arsenite methyltransferase [Deltaproteobacteria bacterium]|nr:arsenite methyltransferase [Deltaproteobacteria bacterium]MBW2537622.1 arsenite methyltransferase [Deltaproteobacteria bacterium]
MPSSPAEVHQTVREAYGKIASIPSSSCCGPSTCCGGATVEDQAERLGYRPDQLAVLPDGANLGLGCGNPTALASLRPGEVVVDLGAGAGIDAFIAARSVGPTGRIIGIDMTPEMLTRARENAVRAGVAGYVEFREGIIEKMPVVADSVDVIISNCVINLSPDKEAVFREAFRVLKPGGRLAVSDILLSEPLPEDVRRMADLYVGCVAGALVADDYLGAIEKAGFVDLSHERRPAADLLAAAADAAELGEMVANIGADRLAAVAASVWSYSIEARKP